MTNYQNIAAALKAKGYTSRDGTYLQGPTLDLIEAIVALGSPPAQSDLVRALEALATRVLDYVGDVDDPQLDADQEMRNLARAALTQCAQQRTIPPKQDRLAEAEEIIAGLICLERGSGERALAFLQSAQSNEAKP